MLFVVYVYRWWLNMVCRFVLIGPLKFLSVVAEVNSWSSLDILYVFVLPLYII